MSGRGKEETGMNERLSAFVRSLYFDIHRIDGVNPLEIWNGIREISDPFERTSLIKNLFKIVIPLVNGEMFDMPFTEQSRAARQAVSSLFARYRKDPVSSIFSRFPDPPVRDEDQKALYAAVKSDALPLAKEAAKKAAGDSPESLFRGGLFDLREMRVVDNELPYIIFTDKEFRVIHGMVIVYLWLIDLGPAFLSTLEDNGVGGEIPDEYRRFERRVLKEAPLVIQGKKMEPSALASRLGEKLKYEEYHDVFEAVYRWLEGARERFASQG